MKRANPVDLTMQQAQRLLAWKDGWKTERLSSYECLGAVVFGEMIGDAEFRELVIKQLRLPKGLRVARQAKGAAIIEPRG
jgi:hypothetical protein